MYESMSDIKKIHCFNFKTILKCANVKNLTLKLYNVLVYYYIILSAKKTLLRSVFVSSTIKKYNTKIIF